MQRQQPQKHIEAILSKRDYRSSSAYGSLLQTILKQNNDACLNTLRLIAREKGKELPLFRAAGRILEDIESVQARTVWRRTKTEMEKWRNPRLFAKSERKNKSSDWGTRFRTFGDPRPSQGDHLVSPSSLDYQAPVPRLDSFLMDECLSLKIPKQEDDSQYQFESGREKSN